MEVNYFSFDLGWNVPSCAETTDANNQQTNAYGSNGYDHHGDFYYNKTTISTQNTIVRSHSSDYYKTNANHREGYYFNSKQSELNIIKWRVKFAESDYQVN